jgi:hypothetical protein
MAHVRIELLVPADVVLVRLFLLPDDGSDTFLRNICSYKSHMASHPIPEDGFVVVTAVKTSNLMSLWLFYNDS